MKSGFSKLSKRMSSSLYGHLHMVLFGCFAKLFQKRCFSLYTEKHSDLGVLSEKTSKIFIPPVIRRFEWLIGVYFSKVFQKNLSSSLYAEKSSLLGPLPRKKIKPFTIRRFQRRFGAPKSESFYIKKKTSARRWHPYGGVFWFRCML